MYKVISENMLRDLELEVSRLMELGWKLHRGLVIDYGVNGFRNYMQVMVKEDA